MSADDGDREGQRRLIENLIEGFGAPGKDEIWYVVSIEWWKQFQESDEELGPVDNAPLYDPVLEGLKFGMVEETHYKLVCDKAWARFVQWFGASHTIQGEVVSNSNDEEIVDLFPARFNLQFKVEKETDESEDEDPDTPSDTKTSGETSKDKVSGRFQISRYEKFSKLKGKVAKFLKKKAQSLSIDIRPTNDSSASFQRLDKIDLPAPDSLIMDVLPGIGMKMWEMTVVELQISAKRLSVMERYNPQSPVAGQKVDAKLDNVWLEGVIEEVIYPKDKKGKTGEESPAAENTVLRSKDIKIKVHFLSFESSKDKVFSIGSEDVVAAYTKVGDWRSQLRTGEKVEICKRAFSASKEWIEAEVVNIDRSGTSDLRTAFAKQLEHASAEDRDRATSFISKVKNKLPKFPFSAGRQTSSSKRVFEDGSTSSRKSSIDSQIVQVSYHGLVEVRVGSQFSWSGQKAKRYVLDLGGEDIAAENTHIAKKSTGRTFGFSFNRNEEKKPKIHGVVGFRNLGNTCYMNSALQCFMHTESIAEYFLTGKYKEHYNRKNPIGFGGKVAASFGNLMESYFGDSYATIAPQDFKNVIASTLSSFAGFGQHDTHEFVDRLIDALHEDLNLVINKPATEDVEANGRPDSVVAKEAWERFLLRNRSVFVDTLYGQLKSHLVCPDCNNEATKFDAFSSLIVPIPVKNSKFVKFVFVSLHPRRVKVVTDEEGNETHSLVEKATKDDTIIETRFFRFTFEAKDCVLYAEEIADVFCKKFRVDHNDLAMYELSFNKPSSVFYHSKMRGKAAELNTDAEFVAYELDPLEGSIDTRSKTASVVGDELPEAEATDAPDANPEDSKEEIKTATVINPTKTKSSDSSDDEDDEGGIFINVKYKGDSLYSSRGLRVSDMLRYEEGKMTIKDLYLRAWKRCKFMFDIEDVLKETGYSATNYDTTEEEWELCKRLITVRYVVRDLDPESEDVFEMRDDSTYLKSTIEISLSKDGFKYLQKKMEKEAPSPLQMHGISDKAKSDRCLNVGFMYQDESTKLGTPNDVQYDLYQCFDAFQKKEILGEQDPWYCGKCKNLVRASKKMDVYSTGETLIIALKRFRSMRFTRDKLNVKVDFPLTDLDLSRFILSEDQPGKVYDLYAVGYHMGSLIGGHYVAKVKVGDKWYEMNDSFVRECDEDSIVSSQAYVLYYRLKKAAE